jgi:hypothetical protein
MKETETSRSAIYPFGWLTVCTGIGIFITGIAVRTYFPGTIADIRLLEGFGIFLTGLGIIPLYHSLTSRRDPTGARRKHLAENDERAVAMRNKAGFITFLFSMAINNIVLITYSALTRGQAGFDPLWFTLIFLVIAPVIVFAGMILWQNRE